MRIGIAEDDIVYRAGLVRLLQAADVEVVHQAASGAELIAYLATSNPPDIVILDIKMANQADEGLVAALRIGTMYPEVGILLLSSYAVNSYTEKLFAGGHAGRGYMLKESFNNVKTLRDVLGLLCERKTYSDPKISDEYDSRRQESPADRLTAREGAILDHLATGASSASIAVCINSSTKAIDNALNGIYNKLELPDGPEYNRRILAVLKWKEMRGD
jgi:DNA-binding NarL/FixJ family response regulator